MVNGEQQLPDGWTKATIGDIATSMKNGIYKTAEFYADDGIACLRMYNIEDGAIVWKDIKRMKLTEDEIDTYRLLPGDILVNRVNSRELVGKAAIITEGIETIVYESKNIRLRINQQIADSKFINFCFGAFGQRYFNYNAQQVVGMASINQSQIAQLPIPLPPLAEQKRIVAKIEELFTQLDAGTSALARVQAGLRRYKASVLKAAVEGKLGSENDEVRRQNDSELPEGWQWTTIGELASVGTGSTPLRSKEKYWKNGTIPWVTSGALNDLQVFQANEFVTEIALKETNVKIFPAGTLLVAMYGEGKTRGKVSELMIDATTNQACAALVFDKEKEEYKPFIKIFFQKYYEDIRLLSSGGVQPNLNLSIIKNTRLPLPQLEEQRRIVAEVERRLSVAREVESVVEKAMVRAARVRQSILKRAFEGKLS